MIATEEKEARKNSIGGSDTPIIMGFSSFKTPYILYLEKLGLLDFEESSNEQQYWGITLEKVVLEHFERVNQVSVVKKPTLYHKDFPFIRANLDGFIEDWNAVLEIKCSDKYQRNEWGEDGSDEIPMAYLVQVAHYCAVANVDKAYIAVLIGGNEYRQFTYYRDKELEFLVIDAVCKFWEYLENKIEPELITIEDYRRKYRFVDSHSIIKADNAIRQQVKRIAETKAQIKELMTKEKYYQMEIMRYMKSAECIIDEGGKPLVTWKAQKNGRRTFLLKQVLEQ